MIRVDPRHIGSPKRIKEVNKWIGSLEIMSQNREDEFQKGIVDERLSYWRAYLKLIKVPISI